MNRRAELPLSEVATPVDAGRRSHLDAAVRDTALGVVLAGGESSRMGRTKALLPFGPTDQPLVLRAAQTLHACCGVVEVAAGGLAPVEAAVRGHFSTIEDAGERAEDGRRVGPLGAIGAALDRCVDLDRKFVLVLGCDMPLVTAADFAPLTRAVQGGADAAWYYADGRDHPLCAAFACATVDAARSALERGARRVVALLDERGTHGRTLRLERLHAGKKSRDRLMNVNTPRDYDQARESPTV